ncbi:MAG: NUDIX domain-containing protein [Alphaproteobacteria bacterium]|nr:NUDIX domain-containing protein [Alphaproteobacteria bacterium]
MTGKIVLIVTGKSRSGKDLFVEYLRDYLEVFMDQTTSIQRVNEVIQDTFPEVEFKQDRTRKLQFRLKMAFVEYGNIPNLDAKAFIIASTAKVVTVMIRELDEAVNLKNLLLDYDGVCAVNCIHVENTNVGISSDDPHQHADQCATIADLIIHNNGDRDNLRKLAKTVKTLCAYQLERQTYSKKDFEKVMCVCKRSVMKTYGLCAHTNTFISKKTLPLHALSDLALFVPRFICEHSKEYLQIIPYVLVRRPDGKILTFDRYGTEQRLHSKKSVGVGGHISQDENIFSGLVRELKEELVAVPPFTKLEALGVIYTDEQEVSACHIGMVFLMDILNTIAFESLDSELSHNVFWCNIIEETFEPDFFESWGNMAIRLLREHTDDPTN